MEIDIVLGLGFGDEGKGNVVNSLITYKPDSTLVVRFNGGHQAAHHVIHKGVSHIFSNFGSGTLKGVPTYWSKFCTVDPMGFNKEWEILQKKGITPKIYMDANAMVTTPMDKAFNQMVDDETEHGSVGVGFGETIQRNKENYRLFVRDLYFPVIRDAKLDLMYINYHKSGKEAFDLEEFKLLCDSMILKIEKVDGISEMQTYSHIIFEGAQGIMLDQKYGLFPHVTRSNTTSKNANVLVDEYMLGEAGFYIEDYKMRTIYVTRAYQTRHGNGPMTNEHLNCNINNPDETNKDDGYQGKFRKTILDMDLIAYALSCNYYESKCMAKDIVITCLDQVDKTFPVTKDGNVIMTNFEQLEDILSPYKLHGFYSPEGNIKEKSVVRS